MASSFKSIAEGTNVTLDQICSLQTQGAEYGRIIAVWDGGLERSLQNYEYLIAESGWHTSDLTIVQRIRDARP